MKLEGQGAWVARCLLLVAVFLSEVSGSGAQEASPQPLLSRQSEASGTPATRFPRQILEGECRGLPLKATVPLFLACIEEAARVLLPPYDPQHPEKFGREYDPAKYVACMRASRITIEQHTNWRTGEASQSIQASNLDDCRKYRRLKPDEPEVWPTAARPVWPPLPDGRGYNPPAYDMEDKKLLHRLSIGYFERLCKGESKEVILKTADHVDGVYLVRPNVSIGAREFLEPHLLEDVTGVGGILSSLAPFRPPTAPDVMRVPDWYVSDMRHSHAMNALILPEYEWPVRTEPYVRGQPLRVPEASEFTFKPAYEYVEFPRWEAAPDDPKPYVRASRNPQLELVMADNLGDKRPEWRNKTPFYIPVSKPKARYGVTWRGFEASPGDRELGIYGNEYLVVNLATMEVMAYMRTFVFSGQPSAKYWASGGGWLDRAAPCRERPVAGDLLKRVLKPVNTYYLVGQP